MNINFNMQKPFLTNFINTDNEKTRTDELKKFQHQVNQGIA